MSSGVFTMARGERCAHASSSRLSMARSARRSTAVSLLPLAYV